MAEIDQEEILVKRKLKARWSTDLSWLQEFHDSLDKGWIEEACRDIEASRHVIDWHTESLDGYDRSEARRFAALATGSDTHVREAERAFRWAFFCAKQARMKR
jgi:hypothetical protein